MSGLLEGLNPEQRAAVEATEGPLLILAGAGSGKTRVLTRRVAYLLERGVRPWNILAVTFTNKAAGEMRERVAHLVADEVIARDLWVSTFHSTCVKILRRDIEPLGYGRQFVIYDDDDQTRVLKDVLAELKIDAKRHPPAAYRSLIDRAKNALREVGEEMERPRAAEVWRLYEARLRKANALDFNDLVNKVVELWEKHPDVLAKWQGRFRYVMVDEYQDTNAAQYRLVRLLTNVHRNLAVVGDDDQSIYSFRGADIRNILDFEKDFPDATVVKLERNYRSTGTILKAASELVRRNLRRKDKTLWTEAGAGDPIRLVNPYDDDDEAAQVVGEIRRLIATGRRPGELAVIYRTNAQSRPVEQALLQAKVPYVLVGGRKFYERREVRDVLAYLKLVLNPSDDVAFLRIVNVPTRGLGDKAVEGLQAEAARAGVPLRTAARTLSQQGGRTGNALAAFSLLMDRLEQAALTMEPGELALHVAKETGYLAALEAEKTDEAQGRIENLQELGRAAADAEAEDEDAGPIDRLRVFLDTVSLSAQADDLPDEGGGAVTLLTAHLAKGLEYPVVFVIGLCERAFPHARAELEEEIEEERRLAYVAITRARERLYLSWPQRRRGPDGFFEGALPSRFLKEVPPDLFVGAPPPRAVTRAALPPRPPTPPRPPGLPSFGRPTSLAARPSPPAFARPAPPQAARPAGRTLQPESMEAFQVGTEVFHPSLGAGTVRKREGIPSNPRLTIHFRDHGPRTVFAASANLVILLP
ncbi:MAG: ATP-dependent helicase [Myxococcota bacterium]